MPSAINNYESGGVKMIDIDSMIKALRLAWLKRIFSHLTIETNGKTRRFDPASVIV